MWCAGKGYYSLDDGNDFLSTNSVELKASEIGRLNGRSLGPYKTAVKACFDSLDSAKLMVS